MLAVCLEGDRHVLPVQGHYAIFMQRCNRVDKPKEPSPSYSHWA